MIIRNICLVLALIGYLALLAPIGIAFVEAYMKGMGL